MIISRQHAYRGSEISVFMSGVEVKFAPEIKILGVLADERFPFASHVREIAGRAGRNLSS